MYQYGFLVILLNAGTYDEARLNLPRVESGLPILDDTNTGRGHRERKRKKITLPGESTTDFDSETEVVSKPAPQSVVKATKHSKKSPKKTSRKPQSSSTPILKPPAGLQINKNTSNGKKKKHLPGHYNNLFAFHFQLLKYQQSKLWTLVNIIPTCYCNIMYLFTHL